MVLFGIKIKKDEITNSFFKMANEKLEGVDYLKNPFTQSGVYELIDGYYIVSMKLLYFNPTILFLLLGLSAFMFGFYKSAIILGTIMCFLLLLYSKYFYYLMMCLGLKKKGYKGKIKLISNNNIIYKIIEVIIWDNSKCINGLNPNVIQRTTPIIVLDKLKKDSKKQDVLTEL